MVEVEGEDVDEAEKKRGERHKEEGQLRGPPNLYLIDQLKFRLIA